MPPELMSCGAIAGEPVTDRRGLLLGYLEHVMIDVRAGRVVFGLIARGGVMGLGDRLYAIPWSAFAFDEAGRSFVVDVAPERLEASRGHEKGADAIAAPIL